MELTDREHLGLQKLSHGLSKVVFSIFLLGAVIGVCENLQMIRSLADLERNAIQVEIQYN
ncbi:MAG: hypothetical protein AAF384_06890 [Pseudomonadota bacterium]